MCEQSGRKPYPSDVTDAQWELLAPLIPEPSDQGRQASIPRRELVNGVLYVLRTGCSWRQMPHDLPNGKTVYHYFRQWKLQGIWEQAMTTLRRQARAALGRDPEPSAAIIDSQSIKTGPVRGIERGYDGGKRIWGRKRHLLVDTLGFVLAVIVHQAGLADRWGALLLLEGLRNRLPRVHHLFADHGYPPALHPWIAEHLGWTTEIVSGPIRRVPQLWVLIDGQPVRLPTPKPPPRRQPVPKRWVVERTFAWLTRFRRLARDYEGLPSSCEAFIQVAATRLCLKRLAPF